MKLKKSCLIVLLLTLSGCSFLPFLSSNDNNYKSNNNNNVVRKSVTIKIVDGDNISNKAITTGDYASIGEILKAGYGCDGYYDSEIDGVKYFDGSGKSVMEWQEDFPTTFYARWKAISSFDFSYTYTETQELNYHFSYGNVLNATLKSAEYQNMLKGNNNKNVVVNISFYGSETHAGNGWVIYFKTTSQYAEGNYNRSEIAKMYQGVKIEPTDSYQRFSAQATFSCRDAYAKGIYCFLVRGVTTGEGSISDMRMEFSFR